MATKKKAPAATPKKTAAAAPRKGSSKKIAKSTGDLAWRQKSYPPGKAAKIASKSDFACCFVMSPVDVSAKGSLEFQVTLLVTPAAGKVTFVPKGKESFVADSKTIPSGAALTDLLRRRWQKKGGDPPTVVNHNGPE